jgi:hypothetical protein
MVTLVNLLLLIQIRLNDRCRAISERENELTNNHGLSMRNILENENIEKQEEAVEVTLPKSDLSDHGVGFMEEQHQLIHRRVSPTTGRPPKQGAVSIVCQQFS